MKKIFVLGICLSAVSIAFAQNGNDPGKKKAGQRIAPAPAVVAPTPPNAVKNTAGISMPSPSQIVKVTDPAFKKQKAATISPARKNK
jgi:hypothetical protein